MEGPEAVKWLVSSPASFSAAFPGCFYSYKSGLWPDLGLAGHGVRFGIVSGRANSRMSSGMEEERDGPSWGTQSDLGHCTDLVTP